MSPDGLLVVDKPAGITSHDAVDRVRRVLGTRKVGHAGTLDPMATGVLVMGVGRATRLLGHLALTDKRYRATIRLGSSTSTDDREGEVTSVAPAEAVRALDSGDIAEALARQTGDVQQRPSAVSAIKVAGRRAYELARSGEDVELPARRVVVSRLDVLDERWAPGWVEIDVDIECSTGTYVRAIARDVGQWLGVGGHLTALRRTRVGPFTSADMTSLDDLAEVGESLIRPLAQVARECFPIWQVSEDDAAAVRHGRRVPWLGPDASDEPVAIVDSTGSLVALARNEGGMVRSLMVVAD